MHICLLTKIVSVHYLHCIVRKVSCNCFLDVQGHQTQTDAFQTNTFLFLGSCPNISTTPITAMGCRQCLPLSVVQQKGKHCQKPHCHNGVVDTFGHQDAKRIQLKNIHIIQRKNTCSNKKKTLVNHKSDLHFVMDFNVFFPHVVLSLMTSQHSVCLLSVAHCSNAWPLWYCGNNLHIHNLL